MNDRRPGRRDGSGKVPRWREPRQGPPPGPRLFFGLWPDARVAEALESWARGALRVTGGRATPAGSIHLTLAFLGEVHGDRLHPAIEAAERVRAQIHAFRLAQTNYWPHNRIVWAGPGSMPEALGGLAMGLRRELGADGFHLDTRDFQAHVTLVRNARTGEGLPDFLPVSWNVDEFVLVRSQLGAAGPAYDVLERFALA